MGARPIGKATLWVALTAAPLVACALLAVTMSDVAEVPLHWDGLGRVTRWGSAAELIGTFWILAGVMSATNFSLALLWRFNDRLYDRGLVHGVSRGGARRLYVALAVLDTVIAVAAMIGVAHAVLARV